MKKIVENLTKSANLLVDACAGMFSITKACTLFPKRRRFIGCEVEQSCVIEAMPQLIVFYA